MHNLIQGTDLTKLSGAIAAGTDGARVTSLAEVDTKGYSNALVVFQLGTVTSGGVLTAYAKSSNTSGSYGSGTVGDINSNSATDWSNKFVVLDCCALRERYLRVDYQRTAANVVVDAIFVMLYGALDAPTTDATADRAIVSGATPSTT